MNVTRDEAAEALGEIGRAGRRMSRLQSYNYFAVYLVIWGVVWLVANSITDVRPQWVSLTWGVMVSLGGAASFIVGLWVSSRMKRRSGMMGDEPRIAFSMRFMLLGVVLFCFFVCLFAIVGPLGMRQVNTVISLFFPFVYMGVGLFAGWRLFAIGAVTAALIMVGYLWITEHFFLWMGFVAGGALIAGGLWLRKA
jgi:hypothetical protein